MIDEVTTLSTVLLYYLYRFSGGYNEWKNSINSRNYIVNFDNNSEQSIFGQAIKKAPFSAGFFRVIPGISIALLISVVCLRL